MDWLREGVQCTKCGGSRFHYSGGCKKCEENPYDKIKQLEAENQRLTEAIKHVLKTDTYMLKWVKTYLTKALKGSKSDTLRKQEE